MRRTEGTSGPHPLAGMKEAVVVLTKLPEYKIGSSQPQMSQQFYSENENFSSSEYEQQWTPEDESSASDLSASKKRRKYVSDKTQTCIKSAPKWSEKDKDNNHAPISPTVVIASAFSLSSNEIRNARPDLPEKELKLDMVVLARKRAMRWQWGKIVEIITREDGRLKYKVSFKEKGKSLVSGHHMAFDTPPKLEELYVGARVVVKYEEIDDLFIPGVLAELPCRKNHLRFLIFRDDAVPVYVCLPRFRLVCRPLENVLEEIPDGLHKTFMTKYLADWPYPHLTQYSPGQTTKAELEGVQQKCRVELVDCSLMKVVFLNNQHKEWLYRGSLRLEHMAAARATEAAGRPKGRSA